MGRESEESSLPSLQDSILYGERKDGQTLSHPYNGLFTNRSPQVIRCTASMDVHQSPQRRTTSSSLFDLINDDCGATNTTTPPRAQRGPARNPRSCPRDETPRASDVTRFGSSTHLMPRNPVLGASPQPAGFLGGCQTSIPAHLLLPPLVRRTSDTLSEAESSFSGYSKAEPLTRRSFSTTSSASSASLVNDHELNLRPITLPAHLLVADEGQRLTLPDKRSPDFFFSSSYSSAFRPVAASGSSRAPISCTTKACNTCRSRKVRCDAGGQAGALVGSEMPCSRCKVAGLTCVYSAQQRRRGPIPGTKRSESATQSKSGGDGSETPDRRPSAISTWGPSHFDDDPAITMRMLNRPTPYRSASIFTFPQGPHAPSLFDSKAPPSADPYPHDKSPIPQHHGLHTRPPVIPSPTWTNFPSKSSASTGPNTPYLPSWSQIDMSPGSSGRPLIISSVMLNGHALRPASPAVMDRAGSATSRGKTPPDRHQRQASPRARINSHNHARSLAVARERASAEEEGFRNGYTMAYAQFPRQKELDRGDHKRGQDRDGELSSVRLPPILVGTGR